MKDPGFYIRLHSTGGLELGQAVVQRDVQEQKE